MIPIKPLGRDLCRCPRCQQWLNTGTVIINGMRNLLDTTCPSCQADYYIDLPSGHALLTPVAIDKATREVFDPGNADWFSKILSFSVNNKMSEEAPIHFYREQRHDNIVLLNCLDFLYGHCLLKLLNAQYYLDHHPELACCVLIPKQLRHLVPNGVAEIWEVDLPLKSLQHWYISLQNHIRQEIQARDTCYLSVAHSHPHYSRYDLHRFVRRHDENITVGHGPPIVVFAYREDRLWGRGPFKQVRNINALYARLRLAFPAITFVVTGFGRKGSCMPGIVDERVTHFSVEQEHRWLDWYAAADCAIGVHGSNMLLPSGLAQHVVELLPEDKISNFTQDLLWPPTAIAGNDALYRMRILPGRRNLNDVRPELVAAVVVRQLAGQKAFTSFSTTSLLPINDARGVFDTREIGQRISAENACYMADLEHLRNRLLGKSVWMRLVVFAQQIVPLRQQKRINRLVQMIRRLQ